MPGVRRAEVKKLKTLSTDENIKQLKFSSTAARNAKQYHHFRKWFAVFIKRPIDL